MKIKFASGLILGCLVLALEGSANAQIVNGNFEAGNTGFTSGYTFTGTVVTAPGTYAITTNPANSGGAFFASFGDHTTGTGNMLLADGAASASTNVWQQSLTLLSNTTYTARAFARNASSNPGGNFPQLLFALSTNGGGFVNIGSPFTVTSNAAWNPFTSSFSTGANTTFVLAIRDLTTAADQNDFAIDDITLTAAVAPEASTLALFAMGMVTCVGVVSRRRKK